MPGIWPRGEVLGIRMPPWGSFVPAVGIYRVRDRANLIHTTRARSDGQDQRVPLRNGHFAKEPSGNVETNPPSIFRCVWVFRQFAQRPLLLSNFGAESREWKIRINELENAFLIQKQFLELVKFLGNSYLVQIDPFQFLKFCNINVYHLESLFWHEKVIKFISHLIIFQAHKTFGNS
jgi:hypothetical protein